MKRRKPPARENGTAGPMVKAMEMTVWQHAETDPQGSWTGTPADPEEVPVQDADDL